MRLLPMPGRAGLTTQRQCRINKIISRVSSVEIGKVAAALTNVGDVVEESNYA